MPVSTDKLKMYLAYALNVAYSPNLSRQWLLPVWFSKISPANIFPYTVLQLGH